MRSAIPRLRMFAGPNGSGKSTIHDVVRDDLKGIYINPDEIEKSAKQSGAINFEDFSLAIPKEEIEEFISASSLAQRLGSHKKISGLVIQDGKILFNKASPDSYVASIAASLIRDRLIEAGKTFTFETVMSHSSKLDILKKSKASGYRNYLYYVATDDPDINVSRVIHRVRTGGHTVPEDKIRRRYFDSLALLVDAINLTDRAFVFDNSGKENIWLAEITSGESVEFHCNEIPDWFNRYFLEKLVV